MVVVRRYYRSRPRLRYIARLLHVNVKKSLSKSPPNVTQPRQGETVATAGRARATSARLAGSKSTASEFWRLNDGGKGGKGVRGSGPRDAGKMRRERRGRPRMPAEKSGKKRAGEAELTLTKRANGALSPKRLLERSFLLVWRCRAFVFGSDKEQRDDDVQM